MDEWIDKDAMKVIQDQTSTYEEEEKGLVDSKIKHEKDPGKAVKLSLRLDTVRHNLKLSLLLTAAEKEKGRLKQKEAHEGPPLPTSKSSPVKKTRMMGLMGYPLVDKPGINEGQEDVEREVGPGSVARKKSQSKRESNPGTMGGQGGQGGRGQAGRNLAEKT